MSDFYLVAKRVLDANDFQVFRYHYTLGAEWKLCCARLNMERGNFFHACYRIEAKLGKAYMDTQPFHLFPLSDYFAGPRHGANVVPFPVPAPKHLNGKPLVPPLAPKPAPPEPEPEPEPAPALEPEPEPEPVIWDEAAILKQTRVWWSDGISSRAIAARWAQKGIPCPNGAKWTTGFVRMMLIRAPRAA
jgi:hypothetical protein